MIFRDGVPRNLPFKHLYGGLYWLPTRHPVHSHIDDLTLVSKLEYSNLPRNWLIFTPSFVNRN